MGAVNASHEYTAGRRTLCVDCAVRTVPRKRGSSATSPVLRLKRAAAAVDRYDAKVVRVNADGTLFLKYFDGLPSIEGVLIRPACSFAVEVS